jgi:hypothetical protein
MAYSQSIDVLETIDNMRYAACVAQQALFTNNRYIHGIHAFPDSIYSQTADPFANNRCIRGQFAGDSLALSLGLLSITARFSDSSTFATPRQQNKGANNTTLPSPLHLFQPDPHHVQEKAHRRSSFPFPPPKLTRLQIKSLSPLRSSDRRKLADQIIADLHLPLPDKPAEDAPPEAKAAAAAALTDLRNALLPESAMAARFSTTVGAEARTVGGTVYAAALAPGGEVRVLWVKVDERLYPTGRPSPAKAHDAGS